MIDESTIRLIHGDAPGYLGPLVDDNPHATPGRVRPHIWAYLMSSGGVRREEVVGALIDRVSHDDLRIGGSIDDWTEEDRTPLEIVVDDTLGEMVADGLLRFNSEGVYVICEPALRISISLACLMNAQLPDHLLMEMAGN